MLNKHALISTHIILSVAIVTLSVGCWIYDLLVPRWFKKRQSYFDAMARILGVYTYALASCCYMHYSYFEESRIPLNIALFYRGNISKFFGRQLFWVVLFLLLLFLLLMAKETLSEDQQISFAPYSIYKFGFVFVKRWM